MKRMRVAITGADGFIGRALLPMLAREGYEVRGLVRALSSETVARREFVAIGDLAQWPEAAMRASLREMDAVVHLAGIAHRARTAPELLRAINVTATARLARAAAAQGIPHFVFASSVKVNGEATLAGRPFTESDPPNPRDEYGASKWAAERALSEVAESAGMRATLLRLPLTYGPQPKANVAALARAVRRGVPLPLAGIGNRRSILGVGNLASALAAVLRSDGDPQRAETFFVADALSVSTPMLVEAMARAMRVEPRLFRLPKGVLRLAGAWSGRSETVERLLDTLEVDTGAFRSRFAWSPPHSLDEGMAHAFGGGPSL
jgi:nucleoside-diphosphate-sugar epimerase